MRNIWIFKSINGKLDIGSDTNRAMLNEDLKQHPNVTYRLERIIPKRTINQNNFYWLYLGLIEYETGNNSSDLHEYFKRVHLPPKFLSVMGKEIKVPASTTNLNKLEFGDYMDKISAETSVPIPDPDIFTYQ